MLKITKLLCAIVVIAFAGLVALSALINCDAQADLQNGTRWFRWTAPGDDGSAGQASGYELYWSTDPDLPYDDWNRVGNEPTPSMAFEIDSCFADSLPYNVTIYSYIISFDDREPIPNRSAISNIHSFQLSDDIPPGMIADLDSY